MNSILPSPRSNPLIDAFEGWLTGRLNLDQTSAVLHLPDLAYSCDQETVNWLVDLLFQFSKDADRDKTLDLASLLHDLGGNLEKQSRSILALPLFDATASICAQYQEWDGVAQSLFGRGNVLQLLGQHEGALAAHIHAESLWRRHEETKNTFHSLFHLGHLFKFLFSRFWDPDGVAGCCLNRGNTLQCMNRDEEALAAYARAETLYKRYHLGRLFRLSNGVALCRLNRANALRKLTRYDEALAACMGAELLFEKNECQVEVAHCHSSRASILAALGKNVEALAVYSQAEVMFAKHLHWSEVARCRLNRADVLGKLGRNEEALTACSQAEFLNHKNQNWINSAHSLFKQAHLLKLLRRNNASLAAFVQAGRLFEQSQQWVDAGNCGLDRAILLQALGQYGDALDAYAQTERLFEEHQQRARAANCRYAHAGVLNTLGQYEEALYGYRQAEFSFEGGQAWDNVAFCRYRSAGILANLRRFEESLADYLKAESLFQKSKQEVNLAYCREGCAAVLEALSRHEEALEAHSQAELLFAEHQQWENAARCCLGRAVVLDDLGRDGEALKCYAKARSLFEKSHQSDQHVDVTFGFLNRAVLLRIMNDYGVDLLKRKKETIRGYSEDTLGFERQDGERERPPDVVRELTNVNIKLLSPMNEIIFHHEYARSMWMAGNQNEARNHFFQAGQAFHRARYQGGIDDDRLEFVRDNAHFLKDVVSFALEAKDLEFAFASVQDAKAVVLGDLQNSFKQELVAAPMPASVLRGKVVRALAQSKRDELTTETKNMMHLFHSETMACLARVSPHEINPPIGEGEIRAVIPEGWAVIDFWIQNDTTVQVFVATRECLHVRNIPNPWQDKEFVKTITKWHMYTKVRPKTVDSELNSMEEEWAKELVNVSIGNCPTLIYHHFFRPLESLLCHCRGLYLVPHDYLHYVPLHIAALIEDYREIYLYERFSISYLPSSAFLVDLPAPQGPGKWLSLSNPDQGTSATLPFSHWEGGELAQILADTPGQQHQGAACRYAQAIEWNNSAMVHFSCHGISYSKFAAVSHLRLSDDLLLAHDVMYRTPPLPSGSLVILNGCDTGVRDWRAVDEGMGLMSAFFLRGAGTVLATCWPVADECAAEFVREFVEQYYRLGANLTQAFRAGIAATRHLTADEIGDRRLQLLDRFPKDSFPHEASRLLRDEIQYQLSRGQMQNAENLAGTCVPLLRQLGDGVTADVLACAVKDKVKVPFLRHPYDHPFYWSAFHLIGRVT